MPETVEERLIRIETKLDQVFDRMRDGEVKFTELRNEIAIVKQELAYWKGGLAFVAFVWPIIVKIFFN